VLQLAKGSICNTQPIAAVQVAYAAPDKNIIKFALVAFKFFLLSSLIYFMASLCQGFYGPQISIIQYDAPRPLLF
jgi:hypothetical protein